MNLTIPYEGLTHKITCEATISDDSGGSVTVPALWDTGAMYSMITEDAALKLDLEYVGRTRYYHAGGSAESNVYSAAVEIEGGLKIDEIELMSSSGVPIMLLGMDIINRGEFIIKNVNGNTMFSFRC